MSKKIKTDPWINHAGKYAIARAKGFRSGLEVKINDVLAEAGVLYGYEDNKISYTVPEKVRKYTPDFTMYHVNGTVCFYLETKGYMPPADRMKYKHLLKSNPCMDLRFLFANSSTKITKNSKTTYGMWADKLGFQWCHKEIPEEWFKELKK